MPNRAFNPFAVFATCQYGKSIEGRLGTVVGDAVYKRTNRLRGDCLHRSSPRVALEPKKQVSGTVAAERYEVGSPSENLGERLIIALTMHRGLSVLPHYMLWKNRLHIARIEHVVSSRA